MMVCPANAYASSAYRRFMKGRYRRIRAASMKAGIRTAIPWAVMYRYAQLMMVSAVAVTLDPESVFFVGRLRPLVDEVLPEVRQRLDKSLTTAPEVKAPTQVIGLSVAQGAVYACLGMARERLRDAVLGARSQGQRALQSAPAF